MIYQEAIQFLSSLPNREKDSNYNYESVKLENIKKLLNSLGNPQDKFKSIHVAGTKGKGSTCVFIFNILKTAGYRVGLYTSPHLIDIKERIKITYNDEMNETRERLIEQTELAKYTERIKAAAENIPGLTFFEVYTAIAFCFFADKEVDFAVVETGLGGRLDATNVLKPLVCAITNISLDHTDLLGKSVEKIAREKAGIIKENALVVSVAQQAEAFRPISQAAREKNARLYEVGRDFIYDAIGSNLEGSFFDFRSNAASYQSLQISLLGQFQVENAALALSVIQLLRQHDIVISLLAIKNGLKSAHWPGRMQIVHKMPFVVVDGAQNEASAKALKGALNMLFTPKKTILVLGVSQGKRVEDMAPHLVHGKRAVILTQSDNPRAMKTDDLAKKLSRYQKVIKKTYSAGEALRAAVEMVEGPDDLIVIAGSLYLVGEVFSLLHSVEFPQF